MLICTKCGNRFSEQVEEKINGEIWGCCPNCGSTELEEGKFCKICNNYELPENMISNFCCKFCFEENSKEETFKKYLEENNLEPDFFVEWMFDSQFTYVSADLLEICKKEWKNLGEKGRKELKKYIKENEIEFAEWLEVVKKK